MPGLWIVHYLLTRWLSWNHLRFELTSTRCNHYGRKSLVVILHRGQLVTREQISSALWGQDVFVDVEQGINTAIRKIRRALADDAGEPQYLQTVVGRGYRFVAPHAEEDAGTPAPTGPLVFSAEEFGRAIMTAAGLDPENPRGTPKAPAED